MKETGRSPFPRPVCGLVISFFFLLGIRLADAAPPEPFTLEQVLSSPFPSHLVAAKNAPRIAWVFSRQGANNIWVADAPHFTARQITHYTNDDGMPIVALKLTPDGRTAVYERGTDLNAAGEVADPTHGVTRRAQQLWAVEVDSGQARLLSEVGCDDLQISPDSQFALWSAKKEIWIAPISGKEKARELTFARGDNGDPQWSPDGRKVAFVSHRGDHNFIAIYEFGRDQLRFLAPSVDRDCSPRWSPDGTQLAFIRVVGEEQRRPILPQHPTPWSIWVYDFAHESGREICHSGPNLDDSYPKRTADESFHFAAKNRIVFCSEQDGWNHLYSIAAAGGPVALLTPGQFETEDVALSADGDSVIYSANQNDLDRRHLWSVDVEGGRPTALTQGASIEWSPVEVGGRLVCLGSTATTPAMPYVISDQKREMIAADQLPSDFPSAQLVTPKEVVFKAPDGLEIHGQLFEPKTPEDSSSPERLPGLVFIHGGSMRQMMLGFHNMGYYHNAYAMNQYLVSRHYVVFSVNYRTGVMYGRHFREQKYGGPRGGIEYQDIVAAGHYLQTLPQVDPTRIGLWGGSYGGYLTAMGLARDSDLFKAGVDMHGVHDWTHEWKGAAYADSPDLQAALKIAFQSSPNAYLATWKSPVLLIQGDDDREVSFSQTVDLVQRLRERDVHVEQLVFPDEGHGFLLWRDWIQAYRATAEFFDRELQKKE